MSKSAKSRAEMQFTASTKKRDQLQNEHEQERQARALHTAKLRALRLEKEAAEREAAEKAAAEKAAKQSKKRVNASRAGRAEA